MQLIAREKFYISLILLAPRPAQSLLLLVFLHNRWFHWGALVF